MVNGDDEKIASRYWLRDIRARSALVVTVVAPLLVYDPHLSIICLQLHLNSPLRVISIAKYDDIYHTLSRLLGASRFASPSPFISYRIVVLIQFPAKPTSALIPSLRAGPTAFISSTSSKSATTDVTPQQDAQGPPLSATGKPRREVPLPSQEKKEGAMQYALYVTPAQTLAYQKLSVHNLLEIRVFQFRTFC